MQNISDESRVSKVSAAKFGSFHAGSENRRQFIRSTVAFVFYASMVFNDKPWGSSKWSTDPYGFESRPEIVKFNVYISRIEYFYVCTSFFVDSNMFNYRRWNSNESSVPRALLRRVEQLEKCKIRYEHYKMRQKSVGISILTLSE